MLYINDLTNVSQILNICYSLRKRLYSWSITSWQSYRMKHIASWLSLLNGLKLISLHVLFNTCTLALLNIKENQKQDLLIGEGYINKVESTVTEPRTGLYSQCYTRMPQSDSKSCEWYRYVSPATSILV